MPSGAKTHSSFSGAFLHEPTLACLSLTELLVCHQHPPTLPSGSMPHSNIARVSEDFYPALPASHTAHIANAAFTTLMLGVVAFPDWDM